MVRSRIATPALNISALTLTKAAARTDPPGRPGAVDLGSRQ
jgi:hypothetical protein